MGLERITDLSEPPVVGRYYLVPTVTYPWLIKSPRVWPVFPNLHDDREFFSFPHEHYHVDPRFLDARNWRYAEAWTGRDGFSACQAFPLSYLGDGLVPHPHPPIVWSRRKCQRVATTYMHGHLEAIGKLRAAFAGQSAKKARTGWVCPHRNYPLGSVAPDEDGVVTCPLHGLRVRCSDGLVLSDDEPTPGSWLHDARPAIHSPAVERRS